MERFLPTLYLIASISPLLGLLGTVAGMIKAFQAIENLGGKVDSSVLGGWYLGSYADHRSGFGRGYSGHGGA